MRTSVLRLWIIGVVFAAIFGFSVDALLAGTPASLLTVAIGYLGYELGMALVLTVAALSGIRAWRRRAPDDRPLPSIAVIIAAHNERDFILGTLASIREKGGVPCEVVVASDGSTDGMNQRVIDALKMVPAGPNSFRTESSPPVWLLALPKVGKGAAMNAGLAKVNAEVVVTLDADTVLGENALAELVAPFRDAKVDAAAGFIYVRNARVNLLTRYQFTEYVKNFVWRIGLARMRVNLQVSGAFGALRTQTLRALGGFAEESLVEDYEIIFRLHDVRRREKRAYDVVAVPSAAAFTEVPERFGNFVQQRTRWFTGFLQTLFDYRRMVGSRAHGAIGLFMLPIKCVDACLPVWGFTSLVFLVVSSATASARWELSALALFFGKWLFDAALYAAMVRWHARAFPERQPVPRQLTQYATCMTESLGFNWLRQVAVLRAYVWFFRRTHKWEQPRWQTQPEPELAKN